jgi:hypothetical protein
MAKRRRRHMRSRLGAPEDQHHKRGAAFALQGLRAVEKARTSSSCAVALDKLAEAHKAHGGAVAEASAMTDLPPYIREAVRKLGSELALTQGMIKGRCLR